LGIAPPPVNYALWWKCKITNPIPLKIFFPNFPQCACFYRSPEIISRITFEAIADAAADNIQYLELRFTQ
jgi:adenosine deaminase